MKIKLYFVITLSLLVTSISHAQNVKTPDCIWAKNAVASYSSAGTDAYGIASSGTGNGVANGNGGIYVTGTYDCGSITFGNITLTGEGFFIAKYDSSGNVLWAKGAGGAGSQVATDGSGNVYVTGTFTDTITFGGHTLTSLYNPISNPSVFIVKYSATGNVLWVREGCSFRGCNGYGITTDGNANVFVTGTFAKDSIVFGSITSYGTGAFVAKYDSTGNILWVKSSEVSGGTPGGIGNGVATDADGNVFAAGTFYGDTAVFGNVKLVNPTPATGNLEVSQMFVVKYDPSGNVLWAKMATIDEEGYQSFNGMPLGGVKGGSTDSKGSLYVTGGFYGTPSNFGSVNLTNHTLDATADIFIVKYTSSGNTLWAKEIGGDFDNVGEGVSADNNDNVYVTGSFGGNDTIYFGSTALTGTSDQNIFIAKYDSSGNALQALTAGGPGYELDFGGGIIAPGNGDVYVTGMFSDTVHFDNDLLYSTGGQTIFLDKFNGASSTGIKQVSFNSNDVSVYPNPTSNKISININSSAGDISSWKLEIVDLLGRTIFTKSSLNYNNNIDMSSFANGIYFVTIVNNEGHSVFPIVKQN